MANKPEFVTTFYDSIIDDFGIWQHTDGVTPITSEGYALDDATRGFILSLRLGNTNQANTLFDYIKHSFKDETLYGFATSSHEFIMAPASEDATGQVVWAMGYAVANNFRTPEALHIFEQAKSLLEVPEYLRGPVYALLGARFVDPEWSARLAEDILVRFQETKRGWPWPEEYLTYGNGIVPYALITYGQQHNYRVISQLGLQILEFVDKACRLNNFLGPIGNQGWYGQDTTHPPVYSQQPIDTAYMVWACLSAYQTTNKAKWLKSAEEWQAWFDGGNITGQPMYNAATGLCNDGIDGPTHINTNSGAESNICYLLARLAMDTGKLY